MHLDWRPELYHSSHRGERETREMRWNWEQRGHVRNLQVCFHYLFSSLRFSDRRYSVSSISRLSLSHRAIEELEDRSARTRTKPRRAEIYAGSLIFSLLVFFSFLSLSLSLYLFPPDSSGLRDPDFLARGASAITATSRIFVRCDLYLCIYVFQPDQTANVRVRVCMHVCMRVCCVYLVSEISRYMNICSYMFTHDSCLPRAWTRLASCSLFTFALRVRAYTCTSMRVRTSRARAEIRACT